MPYEKLNNSEQREANSQLIQSSLTFAWLIVLLKISLSGIRIHKRSASVIARLERKKITNKLEKRVLAVLKTILDPLGITIQYERLRILATNVSIDKIRTDPDFSFKHNGARVFIEVGGKHTSSSKTNQLSVVEEGINSPGSKPNILYVQLGKKDVKELEKIARDLYSLMLFLRSRERRVEHHKVHS